MVRIFIDTNVLVRYFLLSSIEKTRKTEEEKENLWKEYNKMKPSYKIIEEILSGKITGEFITSKLAFSEIFYAIYEEYVCRMMLRDGVPLSSWFKVQSKFYINKDDRFELQKDFIELKEILQKNMQIVQDEYNDNVLQTLVIFFKLRTHDAILVSTAHENKCTHFLTMDRDFLEKKKKLSEYLSLQIINPEEGIKILSNKHQK